MIIEDTLNAYLPPGSHLSPADLEKPRALSSLMFHAVPVEGADDYFAKVGYTLVGTATISVTLIDRDKLVANKIDALRNEASSIRAEATAKCTKIEGQIQQLLCLENGVVPEAVPSVADIDDDFQF